MELMKSWEGQKHMALKHCISWTSMLRLI